MASGEMTNDAAKTRKRVAEMRAEERRAARQSKKRARTAQPVVVPKSNSMLLPLVRFVCKNETKEQKDAAWNAVHESKALANHSKRFKYLDPQRTAVIAGVIELTDVWSDTARRIESELAPAWKRASTKQVQEADFNALEKKTMEQFLESTTSEAEA